MPPGDATSERARSFLPLKPTAFHVLLSLAAEDRHGYAIIKEVEDRTGGEVSLLPGALYRFLKRLLEDGLIRELDHRPVPPEEDDERRRYYAITSLGRAVLSAESERMRRMVEWAEDLRGAEGGSA